MLADFQICISVPLKPLHLIINKLYGYFKENNGNKYLTPDTADESKDTLKNMKTLDKIRGLIRSTSKNSDDYDKKYIKIKFNTDDNLPLQKTVEL